MLEMDLLTLVIKPFRHVLLVARHFLH